MKLTHLIAALALTVSAPTAFANTTKCDHKAGGGLFANTNPKPKAPANLASTSTASTATTQSGTR